MPTWSSQKGKVHACSNCGSEAATPYRGCAGCGTPSSFIYMSKETQAHIQERYKGLVEAQAKPKPTMSKEELEAGKTELWGLA